MSSGISFALSKKNFGTFPHFEHTTISRGTCSSLPEGDTIGDIRLNIIFVSNDFDFSEHSTHGAWERSIGIFVFSMCLI